MNKPVIPINPTNKKHIALVIHRLRATADALAAGNISLVDFTYSTDFTKNRIKSIIEIQEENI